MRTQKGFKYRLKPTPEQKQLLLQQGGNARFLWNHLLSDNIEHYKNTGKFKFAHEMVVSIPQIKERHDFLKLSFSQSLQTVARDLDRAMKSSFKKTSRFPRFKRKGLQRDSFTVPQKWRLSKGYVFIPKVGEVKWIKHRPLQGEPKKITISQDGDHWYCSVLCEVNSPDRPKDSSSVVGIDVGLRSFATLSDGSVIDNPRHLGKSEKRLADAQRSLSKKKKGSQNRVKQKKRVQKLYRRIRNQRLDFLHKASASVIAKHSVVLEDLNIQGMMKNRCLSKSISDAGWFEFRRQLEYKAQWEGKLFITIERTEPTSKKCSSCGNIQEMPLGRMVYSCPACGMKMDRDLNAARNILNIGLNTAGRAEINACGVGTVVPTMKQEKECLVN